MTTAYSETLRHARLTAVSDAVGAAGLLRIYSGTRPASGGTATTLLAELACDATTFGTVATNQLTANAISSDTAADNTGTATWFRVVTSGGTFVIDGDVRETGDTDNGEELVLDDKSIVAGGSVSVSSLVITHGNV